MKLLVALLALLTVCAGHASAQEAPRPAPGIAGYPRRVDEYGRIPFADERARLDNVAAALEEEGDATIYLDYWGARRGCAGEVEARAERAKSYLVVRRGIRPDRVIWRNVGYKEELRVDIWVLPRGGAAPYVWPKDTRGKLFMTKGCKARLREIRRTTYAPHPRNRRDKAPHHRH